MPDSEQLVDPGDESPIELDRYPINELSSPGGEKLLAKCKNELAMTGCIVLPAFIRRTSLAQLNADVHDHVRNAHTGRRLMNVYGTGDDAPNLPPDHPRRMLMEHTNRLVPGDLIDRATLIFCLYRNHLFQEFIAACVGASKVHEYADPLGGLVINVIPGECQQPWHFDINEFAVSILTQAALEGGYFEYLPNARKPGQEGATIIRSILQGNRSGVRTLKLQPGDLQVFLGRNSLHRVSPVRGNRERHSIILSYTARPGRIGSVDRALRLFGRVSQRHVSTEGTLDPFS